MASKLRAETMTVFVHISGCCCWLSAGTVTFPCGLDSSQHKALQSDLQLGHTEDKWPERELSGNRESLRGGGIYPVKKPSNHFKASWGADYQLKTFSWSLRDSCYNDRNVWQMRLPICLNLYVCSSAALPGWFRLRTLSTEPKLWKQNFWCEGKLKMQVS